MLNIINNLKPFFEDCYRRISVREYAKIMKISPPTSSSLLNKYSDEGLLIMEKNRNYLFFHTNNKSKEFIDLSRIYWNYRLERLLNYLERNLMSPTIILFGSLSKAEAKSNSDFDLIIFANKKEINIRNFEENLKRKIQLFWFNSFKDIKNKELANNILNGYILKGKLSLS